MFSDNLGKLRKHAFVNQVKMLPFSSNFLCKSSFKCISTELQYTTDLTTLFVSLHPSVKKHNRRISCIFIVKGFSGNSHFSPTEAIF